MLAINFLALANPEKEKKDGLCRWMKTRFWGCTKEMNSVQILSLARRDKKKSLVGGEAPLIPAFGGIRVSCHFHKIFFSPTSVNGCNILCR